MVLTRSSAKWINRSLNYKLKIKMLTLQQSSLICDELILSPTPIGDLNILDDITRIVIRNSHIRYLRRAAKKVTSDGWVRQYYKCDCAHHFCFCFHIAGLY